MKNQEINRVSKKMACELAHKVIGTRKIEKEDENGFYFKVGELLFRIMKFTYFGNRSYYKYFDLKGKWYDGPVLNCTIWVGKSISQEIYYTMPDLQEVLYEWIPNKE